MLPMHRALFSKGAVVALLLLTVAHSTGILLATAESDDCKAPPLPTDLDLITSVESNDNSEVHLHGLYLIVGDDYSQSSHSLVHKLTLRKDVDSQFRIAVQPHNAATLTLVLQSDDSDTPIATSSQGPQGMERQIFATLKATVKYTLSFQYTFPFDSAECPKILMELAVKPSSGVPSTSGRNGPHQHPTSCDGDVPSPGRIVPKDSDNYYYSYESDQHFVQLGGEDQSKDNFHELTHFPITVPHIPGRHQKWKLKVEVQSRFLEGGDLNVIVTAKNGVNPPPKPAQCVTPGAHGGLAPCMFGSRAIKNFFILQELLWAGENGDAGEYSLWLVVRKPETGAPRVCAPYSVSITLHPLPEQETFVTCALDPLPATFNSPGLYDTHSGVLAFDAETLVNLTHRTQQVTFTPDAAFKTSILRLWLSSHETLDIDLALYSGTDKEPIATSTALTGPEGIVVEVSAGVTYRISVDIPFPVRRYVGRDHDYFRFCDSFQLHVHAYPVVDGDAATCSGVGPNIDQLDMQKQLNKSHTFEFDTPDFSTLPFSYAIQSSSPARQVPVIGDITFFVSRASWISVVIPSDNYAGRVQAVLSPKDTTNGPVKYAKQRSIGASIHTELAPGWYALRLLTPYVQDNDSSASWATLVPHLPMCLRFALSIKIATTDACLSPLDLPTVLIESGGHMHRHMLDEYKIPDDGVHLVSFTPKQDTVLHLKVVRTDAIVTMFLTKGAADEAENAETLATSYDDYNNDQSTLFWRLAANQQYTVQFAFDIAEHSKPCKTVVLEISLVPFPVSAAAPGTPPACPPLAVGEGTFPETVDMGKIDEDGEFGPSVLQYLPKANGMPSQLLFEVTKPAHFRGSITFDFTLHGLTAALCACKSRANGASCATSGDCVLSSNAFNRADLATTKIAAGNYSFELRPWIHGLNDNKHPGTGQRELTLRCDRVVMHLAMAWVKSHPSPPMCPPQFQYLPKSFDGVAMLNPLYGNEMHYFQNVLVSQQHREDRAAFTLMRRSVVRVSSPPATIPVFVSVGSKGATDSTNIENTAPGTFVDGDDTYVVLAPGAYEITLTYALSDAQLDRSVCLSVPLEFSVTAVSNMVGVLSKPQASCDSSPAFPTMADHHGHNTLFRSPAAPFSHSIPVTIGAKGGNVEFDIRYPFESGALRAMFSGKLKGASGRDERTQFHFTYYTNRAYLSASLEEGSYNLVITDGVPPEEYKAAVAASAMATCVPYSLHLRSENYGNDDDAATTAPPAPPGQTTAPATSSPRHNTPPEMQCPGNRYDVLPNKGINDNAAGTGTFSSSALRIPFDRESEVGYTAADGNQYRLKRAVETITFVVHDIDQYVRLWIRSQSSAVMQLHLYKGNDTNPIASGLFFGLHTQTLVWRPKSGDGNHIRPGQHMRADIEFYYRDAPREGTDYTTCGEKLVQTSYELYASIFAASLVEDATDCDALDGAHTHHPPSLLTVSQTQTVNSRFFFSQSDLMDVTSGVVPLPHRGGHRPHRSHSGGGGASPRAAELHELRRAMATASDDDSSSASGGNALSTPPPTTRGRQLFAKTTSVANITVVVPKGVSRVALIAHVRYNIHVSNIRILLMATNQTDTDLGRSDGGPAHTGDATFSAEAHLEVQRLGPGTYFLIILESNAEERLSTEQYCLPYHLRLSLTPGAIDPHAPGETPVPASNSPTIDDISPLRVDRVDASDSLTITLTFSRSATPVHGKVVGRLQDDAGNVIKPSTMFMAHTTQMVLVFSGGSLRWLTGYTLVVDPTAVTAGQGSPAFVISQTLATLLQGGSGKYTTAECGCTGDGRCAVGGACRCRQSDGETCSRCPDWAPLSRTRKRLGPIVGGHEYFVCEAGGRIPPHDGSQSGHTTSPGHSTGGPAHTPNPGFTYAPVVTDAPVGGQYPGGNTSGATTGPTHRVHPPLVALRYALGGFVIVTLSAYSLVTIVRHVRQSGGQRITNPFRLVATNEDEVNDPVENDSIVA